MYLSGRFVSLPKGTTHLCPIDIGHACMTFFGQQNEGKVVCSTSQQSLSGVLSSGHSVRTVCLSRSGPHSRENLRFISMKVNSRHGMGTRNIFLYVARLGEGDFFFLLPQHFLASACYWSLFFVLFCV